MGTKERKLCQLCKQPGYLEPYKDALICQGCKYDMHVERIHREADVQRADSEQDAARVR